MLNRTLFSYRLKILRISHKLSTSQLATLLNLKSKGNIANLESGRTIPLVDNLTWIADLFAVSLDWLTGRSNIPYTEELLSKIENEFWEVLSCNINQAGELGQQFPSPPKKYINAKTRSNRYSLKIRANLIFLYMILFLAAITINTTEEEELHLPYPIVVPKKNKIVIGNKKVLLKDIENSNAYMKVLNKNYKVSIVELIKKIFSGEINKPIFDVIESEKTGY